MFGFYDGHKSNLGSNSGRKLPIVIAWTLHKGMYEHSERQVCHLDDGFSGCFFGPPHVQNSEGVIVNNFTPTSLLGIKAKKEKKRKRSYFTIELLFL